MIATTLSSTLSYYIIRHIETAMELEVEQTRRDLQGFWLLETKSVNSGFIPYKGMRIADLVTLTVDSTFNVHGIAYKWREQSSKGDVTYPREQRAKAIVTGSVIKDRIILNWDSTDAEGRSSIQTFEGTLTNANGEWRARGNFLNDVGTQSGRFCAKKVDFTTFVSDTIPSQGCEP